MADNVAITAGTGTSIAADDISSVWYQRVKVTWGPDGTANDADVASGKPIPAQLRVSDGTAWTYGAGAVAAGTPRTTHASDDPVTTALQLIDDTVYTDDAAFTPATSKVLVIGGQADETAADAVDEGDAGALRMTLSRALHANLRDSSGNEIISGTQVTKSVDVTRAADTTTYAINDNFGSTTAGGYTITGAGRISGGSGFIHDISVVFEEDAATPLQGEIDIYDTAITAVADNAALVVSDAEAKTYVGTIPFVLTDAGNNGKANTLGQNLAFTCVGSADLRFVVRTKNAYVPTTNSSVLTVRFKITQTT